MVHRTRHWISPGWLAGYPTRPGFDELCDGSIALDSPERSIFCYLLTLLAVRSVDRPGPTDASELFINSSGDRQLPGDSRKFIVKVPAYSPTTAAVDVAALFEAGASSPG